MIRPNSSLLALILIVWFGAGCGIGYNRTLFVTKTNAGFEASSLPPTLQLDIARLEGVVAPQFEEGKKLPVMASFRFQDRGIFSPAIGSTFATGDAATTLAALYGDDTPQPSNQHSNWSSRAKMVKGDPNPYPADSTLQLEQPPEIRHQLLPLPSRLDFIERIPILGKAFEKPSFQTTDVRPVFFGTDTAFGLKIQWSEMTGHFPDSVKLGYNRKELALVPITLSDDNKLKMASLLATVDSGLQGGSPQDTSFKFLQYFATGDAATLLALRKEVRQAMLARLDPNAEEYGKRFRETISDNIIVNLYVNRIIDDLYRILEELHGEGDTSAGQHVAALDQLGSLAPTTFTRYTIKRVTVSGSQEKAEGLVDDLFDAEHFRPNGLVDFSTYRKYRVALETSINALEGKLGQEFFYNKEGRKIETGSPEHSALKTHLETLKLLQEKLKVDVARNNATIDALNYFYNFVTE